MSLFKTRNFWSTTCDDEESFDQNSLLISKLNSHSDYIISGSHSGVLRIFKPSTEFNENNNVVGYKASDLIIEKIFEQPILQIGAGKLVSHWQTHIIARIEANLNFPHHSGSPKTQLVLLHPRLLSIYSLSVKEGATEHGVQNMLQLNYEHKLRRSGVNFALGQFGGSQNRDFICVQSLDGLLTFYEQESFAFCCFLPDFLIPAPIIYVKMSDSFVTCNSSWNITSFKYKYLSEAGANSGEDDDAGKKINSDWSYNLGESIIDLEVLEDPINVKENILLILGERNLFCISDSGKLKYMKRFEFSPICFTNYILNEKVISLVISETNTLLIYQNTSLKWSAHLDMSPVCIKRAFLHNLSGVIALLSEEGLLECCYLGTEPSLFVAPPLNNQELDFDKAGLELATLNKIIKNSYANDVEVTNASAERELTISLTIKPHLLVIGAPSSKMCEISIDVIPSALFEELQIAVFVQRPFKIQPHVEFFSNLSERKTVTCHAFMERSGEIPSLQVHVVASFVSSLGVPRSIAKWGLLPAVLALETCAPLKEGEHKVTLNINQAPVPLATLFPEFAGENSLTPSTSAIGFKNISGEGKVVTILLAKASDRYRLQSDSFASLSLLIEQMLHRLKRHYSNTSGFSVTFSSPLPTHACFHYIKEHFSVRQNFNNLHGELSQLSAQFRLIQKRLISKFKVKNPSPLSNLELLLQDTFSEIMRITERLEEETENLSRSQIELSCALHLIVNLLKLSECNDDIKTLLEAAFCPIIYDLENQNWEDVTDASLCYLLRTVLAKSEKDKLRAAHTSFDEVKDISKFEKHFSQVLERYSKSGLLETNFPTNQEIAEAVEKEAEKIESVPVGTKLAESSTRLLSARKRTTLKKISDNNLS